MDTDTEDVEQLLAKLDKTASSFIDRELILEARDKLLRLKLTKQTDMATAVAVSGTCQDMCPELERYFRIGMSQTSPFELDQIGSHDETLMVKDYRRSGADQKEPLPHELRSIDVLERTMNYLCLYVIDQFDTCEDKGQWFDFIWSRTRSIRKDITQQHLINKRSVALIETCARFHIFCSFFLCEEEDENFDSKLNEENLSNCLQTLKDFYRDLRHRKLECDNEATFRAYYILLNLRNVETLSELKYFEPKILSSPEVRFAVLVYQAFQSKNYIKFFKFFRQTTFFMSCILNRYLTPFRVEMWNIMRKAYTLPKSTSSISLPVNDVIDLFAFDDFEEMSKMCDHLDIHYDEQFVYLYRDQVIEYIHITHRSKLLVLDKLKATPGEALLDVESGQIDIPSLIQPVHCSFDENNKYRFDASTLNLTSQTLRVMPAKTNIASNQVANPTESIKFPSFTPFPQTTQPTTPKFSFNSQISELNGCIPEETSVSFTVPTNLFKLPNGAIKEPLSNNPFSSFKQFSFSSKPQERLPPPCPVDSNLQLVKDVTNDVFNSMVTEMISQECHRCITLKRAIVKRSEELFDHAIRTVIAEVAGQTLDCRRSYKQVIAQCCNEVFESILFGVISSIVQEAFSSLINARINSLAESLFIQFYKDILIDVIDENLRNELAKYNQLVATARQYLLERKYWLRWRKFFLIRKKYKYYCETFPAYPSLTGSKENHNYNQKTIIDEPIQAATQSLKRRLLYSQYNDTHKLRQFVQKRLASIPVSHRSNNSQEFYRDLYLMKKYISLWMHKVKQRRKLSIPSNFPAAPSMSFRSRLHNFSPESLQKNRHTIIDLDIQQASERFRKKLMQKSNLDYETTVNRINEKLAKWENQPCHTSRRLSRPY